jgi:conjugal transfer pilus assembly protein TraW
MILATILMIEAKQWGTRAGNARATDIHAANPRVEDTRVVDMHVGDTPVSDSRVSDLRVSDPNPDTKIMELGVYGETFPIAEKNLLDVIRAKLQALFQSGKLEEHQKTILKKAKEQMNRPSPVRGVAKTTTPKSFTYDPSIVAPYDLKDAQGETFYRGGTKVNPLDTHSLNCPLLFVDGEDAEQVFWAIRQYQAAQVPHKPKIILVQGLPFDLSRKFNLPVYFDQFGTLVKKLGITQVPAKVSQVGKALVIDEVALKAEEFSESPRGLK